MSEVRLVSTGVSFGDDTIQQSTAFNTVMVSANHTTANKEFVIVGQGGITITLPVIADTAVGNTITFKDATGTADTSSWTILAPAGVMIEGDDAGSISFDKRYAQVTLSYIGTPRGWSI
jgi:hypothetical protein